MSKYNNRRGAWGDSKLEARRKWQLEMLQRAGKISDLRCQVEYELIPEQREPDTVGPKGGVKRGKLIERPVKYVADFVYVSGGHEVVEDVKGMRTREYIIKRKLMLWVHGIRILET